LVDLGIPSVQNLDRRNSHFLCAQESADSRWLSLSGGSFRRKHEKQSRDNGNAQRDAGIGVHGTRGVGGARDGNTGYGAISGKEATTLRHELSQRGAKRATNRAWNRGKTPDQNWFSEITPPVTLVRNAVTAQGELTYAIQ
jgi:hypothetical protein